MSTKFGEFISPIISCNDLSLVLTIVTIGPALMLSKSGTETKLIPTLFNVSAEMQEP
jgi:hypothetical protein